MWANTPFSQLCDISYPIVQAPMAGGITTPELVAAVSNSGGLGSIAAGYLSPKELKKLIKQVKKLTPRPFAVNVFIPEFPNVSSNRMMHMWNLLQPFMEKVGLRKKKLPKSPPFYFSDLMEVILLENVPIVSFTFGILEKAWIQRLKKQNIILIGTASCKQEAHLLEDSGVDIVCLQGKEAGGHRTTFIGREEDYLTPLDTLISDVQATLTIPIIAAGGIMNAQDIEKALQLGADGVQMGTAFLSTKQSGAHPLHKKVLLSVKENKTTLSRAFTGKLGRLIPNTFTSYMDAHPFELLEYPVQHYLTLDLRKAAKAKQNVDYMCLWAGENSFSCTDSCANAFMQDLISKLNEKQTSD